MVTSIPCAPFILTTTTILRPSRLRTDLCELVAAWETTEPSLAARALNWHAFRCRMADSFVQWLVVHKQTRDVELPEAMRLLRKVSELGGCDMPASAEVLAAVQLGAATGATQLVRRIALVPAWQARAAQLGSVPSWLLPLAAAYHFYGPTLLTVPGQNEAFSRDVIQALRDLARIAAVNRGSAVVCAAFEQFQQAPLLPTYWAGAQWANYAEAWAQLTKAFAGTVVVAEPLLIPATVASCGLVCSVPISRRTGLPPASCRSSSGSMLRVSN